MCHRKRPDAKDTEAWVKSQCSTDANTAAHNTGVELTHHRLTATPTGRQHQLGGRTDTEENTSVLQAAGPPPSTSELLHQRHTPFTKHAKNQVSNRCRIRNETRHARE